MSLAYRKAAPEDLAFIIDSWVSSYRSSYTAGLILMDDWRLVMSRQVSRVLSRPGVEVHVAHHPGEQDHLADVYGWIAVEHEYLAPAGRGRFEEAARPLVHYCYVKRDYRGFGIARGLLRAARVNPEAPFRYTCRTPILRELALKIPGGEWNPLIARHPKEQTQEDGRCSKSTD